MLFPDVSRQGYLTVFSSKNFYTNPTKTSWLLSLISSNSIIFHPGCEAKKPTMKWKTPGLQYLCLTLCYHCSRVTATSTHWPKVPWKSCEIAIAEDGFPNHLGYEFMNQSSNLAWKQAYTVGVILVICSMQFRWIKMCGLVLCEEREFYLKYQYCTHIERLDLKIREAQCFLGRIGKLQ